MISIAFVNEVAKVAGAPDQNREDFIAAALDESAWAPLGGAINLKEVASGGRAAL